MDLRRRLVVRVVVVSGGIISEEIIELELLRNSGSCQTLGTFTDPLGLAH